MFRTRTVRLAQRRSQAARASYAPARLGLPTRSKESSREPKTIPRNRHSRINTRKGWAFMVEKEGDPRDMS